MDTTKEILNTKQRIENILSVNEKARNSDKWLCYLVFQEIAKAHDKNIFIPFELFEKFPSFETVSRCRRKIQNKEGRLLPTDLDVISRRKVRERVFSDWAVKE